MKKWEALPCGLAAGLKKDDEEFAVKFSYSAEADFVSLSSRAGDGVDRLNGFN